MPDLPLSGFCTSLVHPRLGMPVADRHDWHELVLVDQGLYRVETAGRDHELRQGQAIFYPAGCRHRQQIRKDSSVRIWVAQWRGWTPAGWTAPFVIDDAGRRLLTVFSWLRDRSDAPGQELLACHLGMALLLEAEAQRAGIAADDDAVARTRQMLDHGPEHPWTLAELARHAGCSRTHLCRAFARRYGEPPLAYLARRRVERAEVLRRDAQRDLASVAREVGYASADGLRRAMRRLGLGRHRGKTAKPSR